MNTFRDIARRVVILGVTSKTSQMPSDCASRTTVLPVGCTTLVSQIALTSKVGSMNSPRLSAGQAGLCWQTKTCPPPSLPRTLNLDQHLDMDTTKIREELEYRETTSRREALRRMVAWDRAHPPIHVDPSQFDYGAEDAIVTRVSTA